MTWKLLLQAATFLCIAAVSVLVSFAPAVPFHARLTSVPGIELAWACLTGYYLEVR